MLAARNVHHQARAAKRLMCDTFAGGGTIGMDGTKVYLWCDGGVVRQQGGMLCTIPGPIPGPSIRQQERGKVTSVALFVEYQDTQYMVK